MRRQEHCLRRTEKWPPSPYDSMPACPEQKRTLMLTRRVSASAFFRISPRPAGKKLPRAAVQVGSGQGRTGEAAVPFVRKRLHRRGEPHVQRGETDRPRCSYPGAGFPARRDVSDSSCVPPFPLDGPAPYPAFRRGARKTGETLPRQGEQTGLAASLAPPKKPAHVP